MGLFVNIMAGDWLKIEKATSSKREVLVIAAELGIHPDHAFGMCFRFWSWCDDNLADGHARGVTKTILDRAIGHDGFAQAVINAGWLIDLGDAIQIPNFNRHLSQSAKNRALASERKRNQRAESHGEVTQKSRPDRDGSVTREEKRRDCKYIEREGWTDGPDSEWVTLAKEGKSLESIAAKIQVSVDSLMDTGREALMNQETIDLWAHSRVANQWCASKGKALTSETVRADMHSFAMNAHESKRKQNHAKDRKPTSRNDNTANAGRASAFAKIGKLES